MTSFATTVPLLLLVGLASCGVFDPKLTVKRFKLTNCGTDNDPLKILNVSVTTSGNSIKLSGEAECLEDIEKPISVKMEIIYKLDKQLGQKVVMKCEKGIGSCTYDDVCEMGIPEDQECPAIAKENNIPCRCPVKKGNYALPEQKMDLGALASLASGQFAGRANVTRLGRLLACYQVSFQLLYV